MSQLAIAQFDLELIERDDGIEVRQFGDAYLAKGWRLTESVMSLVHLAAENNLGVMLQHGHPQSSNRLPNGDGTEYLSFARTQETYWVFAINDQSGLTRKSRSDVRWVLFNKAYRGPIAGAGVPSEIEPFRNASNIRVARDHVAAALASCLPWVDELGHRGGRRGAIGTFPGFRDEADIERRLMENIAALVPGRHFQLLGRQRTIDAGIVDLLLTEVERIGTVVVEVKQGRAQRQHVDEQLRRYLASRDVAKLTKGGRVVGCLVAERIDDGLRRHIRNCHPDIVAFEVRWISPTEITLKLVAGQWPE
jgi:hypothetical protein